MEKHGTMRVGGRYLWAGIAVGLSVIALLYAGKAGWFGVAPHAVPAPALLRRDGMIVIPKDSPLRSRIVTAPAEERQFGETITVPGIVEADPARTVNILPPLAGRLTELKVALGDHVAAGQVLAVIDSPDLAQAYDDDDHAAELQRLADSTLKRQERQFALGVASAHDLDQARSDAAQADAEHARTRARLADLGARPGDRRRLVVRAPASGSVTALSAAQGAMLNDPTQPIMTVADLSSVWVTALVPEKYLGEVAKGQPARVTLDAYPGKRFDGAVRFVADVLDPDTRRDRIRIAFANPDLALKPNMFATVVLQGAKKRRVLLPTSALLMNNDRTTVFVAHGDWTFERRIVDPDLEEGPEVSIGSGVKPGEQVVVKGGILLND